MRGWLVSLAITNRWHGEFGTASPRRLAAEYAFIRGVMCLKVARLFGSTPEFWIRLQAEYDLKKAAQDKKVMQRVAQIVPVKRIEEVHV